jgi:RNA polymerase sigma factor (sigma-70 family)
MGHDNPFTFPITGERLERLKARREDDSLAHPEEWAQLYRQANPKLVRFVRYKLRNYRNAEEFLGEIVSQTWLDLMKRLGPNSLAVELRESYLNWAALGAMKSILGDSFRFDHGVGGVDFEADILNWLEAAAFQSESAMAAAFSELLDKARPPLTERERQIVEMRFINDLTFDQIREVLKLTLGQVSAAYYKAIRQIRAGWPQDPPCDGEVARARSP